MGRADEAIKHLKEMVSRRMNLNVKAYNDLVNEYCTIGKPKEAVLLRREMVAKAIKPSVKVSTQCLEFLWK